MPEPTVTPYHHFIPTPTVTPYHHFIPTPTSSLPTPTPYMSEPGLPTVPGANSVDFLDSGASTSIALCAALFLGITAFVLSRYNRRKQM